MSLKVSVIIPNYNHARYLPQRIESVLNQTFRNIEVILMDDCSPDNSREILVKYAAQDERIRLVFNEQNSGSTFKQWSKGMGLASGKYIWLAESDDYADLTFLEKMVAMLEKDEAIGLAYSASWYVYENKQVIDLYPQFYENMDVALWTHDFVMPGIELVKKFMSYRNIIPNASAVVLRNSIVGQVPPPNGNLRLVGDWLYWASILAVSKVAFLVEPLNYFRFHDNNVRSKSDINGLSLSETLQMLKMVRQYGTPNAFYLEKNLDELMNWWLTSLVTYETKYSLKRHKEIYLAFKQLQFGFNVDIDKKLFKFFLGNKLSGVRQLIGDGLFYPVVKKIMNK